MEKYWGCYKTNIADFQNGSQLTFWLTIGSTPLLLAFSKVSNTAIFSAENSLAGKYATLVSHKMAVLGHNFSFSQMNISMDVRPKDVWTYDQRVYARTFKGSMDVRPKGVWTYVHRIYGWNVASIWLKTADTPWWLSENPFFPFPDCIFKWNIFKYQYVR